MKRKIKTLILDSKIQIAHFTVKLVTHFMQHMTLFMPHLPQKDHGKQRLHSSQSY